MSFSEKTRQWYLRAWGGGDAGKASCQKTFYSEKNGFYRGCTRGNLYVTRIEIEGRGTVGIPICRHHFMELMGVNIYGKQSSLYPELAWARRDYKNDKDSFKKIEHSSETVRTRAGDWSTDEYLFDFAQEILWRYHLNHPDDRMPSSKPKHHRSWVNIIYDGFYGEGQEKS
ncbi:MAG TPA: hypothetical protein PK045_02765 [Candidatus Woesebacteria bacterium]|nr:hypothetical protein [Candidatus Woesebacteria bacterium]